MMMMVIVMIILTTEVEMMMEIMILMMIMIMIGLPANHIFKYCDHYKFYLEPINLLTIEAYQTRMKEANKMNYYNTVGISQNIMHRHYILYSITYFVCIYIILYIIHHTIHHISLYIITFFISV